jgi:hypothetical protein
MDTICKDQVRTEWYPQSLKDCGRKAKGSRGARPMCGIHLRAHDNRVKARERTEAVEARRRHYTALGEARIQLAQYLTECLEAGAESVHFSGLAADDDETTLADLVRAATEVN